MESFIKGYKVGDNITLLNTIYHKPKKDMMTGKYGKDSLDVIYRDMITGEKKVQHVSEPEYTYYMTNEGVPVSYNKLFIEKRDVHPVTCKYRDIKKDIAERTNNLDFFYDNIKCGNASENDKLFRIPSIFNADMHVEDYYRYKFNLAYKNDPFIPTKLYFDIETDNSYIGGAFPEPGECPVNAITLVDDANLHVYTLLLNNPDNPLIEEFARTPNILSELKAFIRERVGGWKNEYRFGLTDMQYHMAFYDDELKLIHDTFNIINTIKPDFALAWNIAFDLPYLIARIERLGCDPADIICSSDFKVKECYYYIDKRASKFEERGDYAGISCYTVYMDQLILFASRRKGQRAVPSYKLDYIGDKFAGVRKLDYSAITTDISKLPYIDYKTFVFYNVMDTIVQLCVEKKVGDVDFVYTKAMTTNTRFAKVHRQTTYLINRGIRDFEQMGYIMGNNVNKSNEKVGFAGAFVADPLKLSDKPKMKINDRSVPICDNCVDFDYKALYPSEIDQNNMAPNTQLGKIILPEKLDSKENRFNNNYFDRTVWFIEDLMSGDALNFCQRYLHLLSYQEMYEYIIWYYNNIKNAQRGLSFRNTKTGLRYLWREVDNTKGREMCRIVDNTKGRVMCIIQERMPKYEYKHE